MDADSPAPASDPTTALGDGKHPRGTPRSPAFRAFIARDWQPDVNGIACALRPGRGLPPMAVSCGGPASSLSKDYLLNEARPLLIEIVAEIEATLTR